MIRIKLHRKNKDKGNRDQDKTTSRCIKHTFFNLSSIQISYWVSPHERQMKS